MSTAEQKVIENYKTKIFSAIDNCIGLKKEINENFDSAELNKMKIYVENLTYNLHEFVEEIPVLINEYGIPIECDASFTAIAMELIDINSAKMGDYC